MTWGCTMIPLLYTLVDKEFKTLQTPCGFRAVPCRFRLQNTKTDKESGNSCKIRLRRMHSIETDLPGIAVFLVRFCIPCQLGYTPLPPHKRTLVGFAVFAIGFASIFTLQAAIYLRHIHPVTSVLSELAPFAFFLVKNLTESFEFQAREGFDHRRERNDASFRRF